MQAVAPLPKVGTATTKGWCGSRWQAGGGMFPRPADGEGRCDNNNDARGRCDNNDAHGRCDKEVLDPAPEFFGRTAARRGPDILLPGRRSSKRRDRRRHRRVKLDVDGR